MITLIACAHSMQGSHNATGTLIIEEMEANSESPEEQGSIQQDASNEQSNVPES